MQLDVCNYSVPSAELPHKYCKTPNIIFRYNFCAIFWQLTRWKSISMIHTHTQVKSQNRPGSSRLLESTRCSNTEAGRRWLSVESFFCRPFKSVSITSTSHSTTQPPSLQVEQIRWTCHTHSSSATTVTYSHIRSGAIEVSYVTSVEFLHPIQQNFSRFVYYLMGWCKKCCTSLLYSEKQSPPC